MKLRCHRHAAPRSHRTDAAQRGFTTVELLITLVIAGILAAIAVPSFRGMLATTRFNSALSLLASDLNQARNEAIKRNSRMLVCVRNTAGDNCGSTGSAAVSWASGWVVCVEGTTVNECRASTAADPNPIFIRPALDSTLTLLGSASQVRFNANSSQGGSGAAAMTLTLGGPVPSRVLTVAPTGNVFK